MVVSPGWCWADTEKKGSPMGERLPAWGRGLTRRSGEAPRGRWSRGNGRQRGDTTQGTGRESEAGRAVSPGLPPPLSLSGPLFGRLSSSLPCQATPSFHNFPGSCHGQRVGVALAPEPGRTGWRMLAPLLCELGAQTLSVGWWGCAASRGGEGGEKAEGPGVQGLIPGVRGDIHHPQGPPRLPQAPEAPRKLGAGAAETFSAINGL